MEHPTRFEQWIAIIDFDKTICNSDYPACGNMYDFAKDVINKWYSQGIYIIINTCRTDRAELEAEVWLLERGFHFHKINAHHPNGLLHYGTEAQIAHKMDSRKIWGHVNIDDTNIDWMLKGHPGWVELDIMMQRIIEQLGSDNKYKILPNFDYSYQKSGEKEEFDLDKENLMCCKYLLETSSYDTRKIEDFEFNLADMAEDTGIPANKLAIMICNLEDTDIIDQIINGDYSEFDFLDENQFNDGYDDMIFELVTES